VSGKAFSRSVLIAYHGMLKDERCCKKEQIKTEEDLPVGLLINKKVTCSPRNGGWSVQGTMEKYRVLVAQVQEVGRLNFTVMRHTKYWITLATDREAKTGTTD
jgi:hypothetical protein